MDFLYETYLQHTHRYRYIVGVDEVGRGPLAGPVCASAFVFLAHPPAEEVRGIRDSKILSVQQREYYFEMFVQWKDAGMVDFVTSSVYPRTIDAYNIHNATIRAMKRCVAKLRLHTPVDYVIVDYIRHSKRLFTLPYETQVKADVNVLSVSCASIVGKVFRDRQMVRYHTKYPQYGFQNHKGYGTAQHYEALAMHGATPLHRKSFRLSVNK